MNHEINPLFFSLMHQYKALSDAGQSDTEEAGELFSQAYSVAPEDFKQMMLDTAVEMGLMPAKPDAFDSDGEPLYYMNDHFERLGIKPADIPEHLEKYAYHGPINLVN